MVKGVHGMKKVENHCCRCSNGRKILHRSITD